MTNEQQAASAMREDKREAQQRKEWREWRKKHDKNKRWFQL